MGGVALLSVLLVSVLRCVSCAAELQDRVQTLERLVQAHAAQLSRLLPLMQNQTVAMQQGVVAAPSSTESSATPLAADQTEAYAVMFYGADVQPTAPGFVSLRTLLYSIRRHDTKRPIVVLTTAPGNHSTSSGGAPPWWRFLSTPLYAPIELARTPPYVVRSLRCLEGLQPGSTRSAEWRQRQERNNVSLAPSRPGLSDMFVKFGVWRLERFKRVIYLDGDTLVLRPLTALWVMEMPPKVLAMAAMTILNNPRANDPECKRSYSGSPYVKWNAGVLLLRPDASVHANAMAVLEQANARVTCRDGDQTLHNVVLRGRMRCFEHTFNCYNTHFLSARDAPSRHDKVSVHSRCLLPDATSPHVVHFAMGSKPWRNPQLNESHYYAAWHRMRRRMKAAERNDGHIRTGVRSGREGV